MSCLENPVTLLVILGVLTIIVLLSVYLVKKFYKPALPQFKGSVLGHVHEVGTEEIVNHLLNVGKDQVHALVIVDKEEYINKKGQMAIACQTSSALANGSTAEHVYNKILKKDSATKKEDLGGIIMSTIEDDVIHLYTFSAVSTNEKPVLYKKSYLLSALTHTSDVIGQFYNQFLEEMPEAMVIAINANNNIPLINDANQTTLIPDDGITDIDSIISAEDSNEDFGMQTGALASWLKTHPSASSVNRYTKKELPIVHNINSFNNAVPAELTANTILVDASNRFQSPQQYASETAEELQLYHY